LLDAHVGPIITVLSHQAVLADFPAWPTGAWLLIAASPSESHFVTRR
jgi:hypothetical protein